MGEMRSILSADVHIMALTATATKKLRADINKVLGMKSPVVVTVNPEKANIKYEVVPFISVNKTFGVLADQLRINLVLIGCAVIFCQRLEDCPKIYHFFQSALGEKFTYPPDSPDICENRIMDMFPALQKHALRTKSSNCFRLSHLHFE